MDHRPVPASPQPIERLPRAPARPTAPSDLPRALGSPRVSTVAAGLVASLLRRRVPQARIRQSASGGVVALGNQGRRLLDAATGHRLMIDLCEAAGLPASTPHGVGAFSLGGAAVRVESYDCHAGRRAIVHVATGEGTAVSRLGAELLDADLAALSDRTFRPLEPEALLAARWHASGVDEATLLTRHADLTLLALAAAHPRAEGLIELLRRAMASAHAPAMAAGVVEALAECLAWQRLRPDGARVAGVLAAAKTVPGRRRSWATARRLSWLVA